MHLYAQWKLNFSRPCNVLGAPECLMLDVVTGRLRFIWQQPGNIKLTVSILSLDMLRLLNEISRRLALSRKSRYKLGTIIIYRDLKTTA